MAVTGVSGLGLTWTRVRAQCAGRGSTGVEVWQARGTPSASGAVTATLASSPGRAVIAVSRYGGSSGVGASASANTNGSGRRLLGRHRPQQLHASTSPPRRPGPCAYGAVALRNRTHAPGAGYSERVDFRRGSGSSAAGLAIEDRLVRHGDRRPGQRHPERQHRLGGGRGRGQTLSII